MDNLGNLALIIIAMVMVITFCCCPIAMLPITAAFLWWAARAA